MSRFLDFPLELHFAILHYIQTLSNFNPRTIAALCLVCRTYYQLAVVKLYEHISDASLQHSQLESLFRTLSSCQHLANYVRGLEIRKFPSSPSKKAQELAIAALENCASSVRYCAWTAPGSLSVPMLRAIQKFSKIQRLEIDFPLLNILEFKHFVELSVIDAYETRPYLRSHRMSIAGSNLNSLTLLSWPRQPSLVNDPGLIQIAPGLPSLDKLHISGYITVTHEGIWAILAHNKPGICELILEHLSEAFDLGELARRCLESNATKRLRSVCLEVDRNHLDPKWSQDVYRLLHNSPLENFRSSTVVTPINLALRDCWIPILSRHFTTLIRLSIDWIWVSPDVVKDVCRQCVVLEEFRFKTSPGELQHLGPALSMARKLGSLYLNIWSFTRPFSEADVIELIEKCPTLTQVTAGRQTWMVNNRHVRRDGQLCVETHLEPMTSDWGND